MSRWYGVIVIVLSVLLCACADPAQNEAGAQTSASAQEEAQVSASGQEEVQESVSGQEEGQTPVSDQEQQELDLEDAGLRERALQMRIDGAAVNVEWEDNPAVEALKKMAGDGLVKVSMSMYGGFEQVGDLGEALPAEDDRTDAQVGDIVLYGSRQIVVFYGSNSWSYTRLGRITDRTPEELEEMLAKEQVEMTIDLAPAEAQIPQATPEPTMQATPEPTSQATEMPRRISKPKGSEDVYNMSEYDDAEELWYDNMDDFDDYEDAEDYWDEHKEAS